MHTSDMDEGWRVNITVYDQPGTRRQSLSRSADDLSGQLGDHVRVTSGKTSIFLYAATAGAAREAEHVAQQVLAQGNVTANSQLERWDPVEEEWQDAAAEPSDATEPADTAELESDEDTQRAVHEELQERERQRSVATGVAAWQVRVDLSSHRAVIDLAERLTSEGWPVVRRRRYLVAGANCEDDADGLAQEIQGYAGADAVIRVEQSVFAWVTADVSPPFG